MYFKEQRLEKAKASTFASTHTVELPETGILDSMSLYFRATTSSPAQNNAPGNIHHHITKIEIIANTDKILYSLTGEQAIAKAFRKMGALPPMKVNEYNGKSQDLLIPIFFGRKYKDGKYALDLSKWDKVELKVTNDFVTTLFTAASLSMETRLNTIEDSVESHPKFLKQWEYQADKPAADTDYVRVKLPSSGILRSLMIQLDPDLTALTAAVAQDPASDNYNWKMFFKDKALTIYDHRPRDIMRDEHRRLGLGNACLKIYPSASRYTDLFWAEVLTTVISPCEAAADTTTPSLSDSRDRYQAMTFIGGADYYQVISQGVGLFHTFEIPYYLPADEEANYLNLDQYKPVEIEWYGYKDDNTHRIILEKPIGQGPTEFA